ncbi:MAG: hypothetical protein U1C57_01325 [Candidatus Doudnabacteria bacterium]|nr:hypothetical protein [bacterium]MDZ4243723.1 hypothetical protein [Candidatus Doudnabacteria bacterium]
MENPKLKIVICLTVLAVLLPMVVFAQTSRFCEIGSGIKVPCFSAPGPAGQTTFGGAVTVVIQIALLIVASLSIIFLIWGGYRYITASGNEEATEAAKNTIHHAILGLLIVVLSFAIITIITGILITGRT